MSDINRYNQELENQVAVRQPAKASAGRATADYGEEEA